MWNQVRSLNALAESYAQATLYNIGFGIQACVVATAAQGTLWEDQIDFLKEYREKRLVRYFCGLALLKLYFLLSIPLVRIISRSNAMMEVARRLLGPTLRMLQFAFGTSK